MPARRAEMSLAGFTWTVKDEPTTGRTWARTVDVDDYAEWGVGLHQVSGASTGPGLSCSGTALVRVEGNPLATPAGAGALGLSILGGLGLLAALGAAVKAHGLAAGITGPLSGLALGLGPRDAAAAVRRRVPDEGHRDCCARVGGRPGRRRACARPRLAGRPPPRPRHGWPRPVPHA